MDLTRGNQKLLEPMSVARFDDFKRIERGGSSRPVGWCGRCNLTIILMLLCTRADRELAIVFEGQRSAQIEHLNI